MKKILAVFVGAIVCMVGGAHAVTITKAPTVAPQESSGTDGAASLVPTVLSLISSVQQLSAKQKELTNECIPSSQEITFVDNIVKAWAKTGAMTADEVGKRLRREKCRTANGGYRNAVQIAAGTEMDNICYDYFAGDGNDGMVWAGFPKVGVATYCSDGTLSCSANKQVTVSDIYDIFNLVDFTTADYTPSEMTMATRLMDKIEKCSYSRLSAKKRQMWGEFLTDTINNLGEPTNTSTIMQSVGSLTTGGLSGGLGSIGALATQVLSR